MCHALIPARHRNVDSARRHCCVAFGPIESLTTPARTISATFASIPRLIRVAQLLQFLSALRTPAQSNKDSQMLYWAAVFFVIALLAAVFGFGGIAASAVGVAKVLFFVFLILAVVSLIFGRRVTT